MHKSDSKIYQIDLGSFGKFFMVGGSKIFDIKIAAAGGLQLF